MIGLSAALGAVLVVAPAVAGIPFVVGGSAAALSALSRWITRGWDRHDRQALVRWTALAFLAHLVIGLTITVFTDAWRYFGPDAMQYHAGGQEIAAHWSGGAPMPSLPAGKEGFFFLLAALYSVFGIHVALGVVVNAGLAAALVPLLCDSTRRLATPEAARHAAPLVTVAPTFLIWPSQLLREAAALFFLATVANCAVRLARRWHAPAAATMVVALALLFTFRGFVALFVAAALFAGLVLGRRDVAAGFGTALVTSLLLVAVVAGTGFGRTGYEATVSTGFERASAARADLTSSAESGFDEGADIADARGALTYLPLGLVRVLFGPFPWQVGSLRQLPALSDALVVWALAPSVVRGLRRTRRRWGRAPFELLMPAAVLAGTLGLVIGNFGTLLRERAQVFVFLVPVVAVGLAEVRPGKAGTSSFFRRLAGSPAPARRTHPTELSVPRNFAAGSR